MDAHQSGADDAFRIETHGVDYVPLNERWATPRHVGGMWAGASVQVEYFIYGAILMSFGFNFAQALFLIVVGNCSYFLLGLASLQAPQAGTTVFAINRASYGTNGSRILSFFNWITQIGFEVEGLILIVGAGLVLSLKAGFAPGDASKVVFVVIAIIIQAIMPVLGHASIVKTLRALAIPFVVIFAVLLIFSVSHATTHGVAHGADWQTMMEGLAFVITLSGLGWTECGNDYTRYCKPESSKKAIVGWVFLGTAVPEILVMTLGAVIATFLPGIGAANKYGSLAPFAHTSDLPSWLVTIFLIFAIVQLFCINSLDMYSSGVTLQAMGLKVKRHQAVLLDCAVAFLVTLYAVFNSSFNTYLTDFVDVVIVWIAPWFAIFFVDWALRKFRYVPAELQRTDKGSLYYRNGGFFWPAIIAQVVGMYAAFSALSTTFSVPHWLNPITWATRDSYGYGADFSIFMGIAVGGLLYLVLAANSVRAQAKKQDELLASASLE
jgi:purine-cytosine permease-like protein